MPEAGDVLEFLLRTHTRLFREHELDEAHFDIFEECLVQALKMFELDQSLIDECRAVWLPLREVFEYGAKVAAMEKTMDAEQLKSLPLASAKTMGSDIPVVLPEYSKIDIPEWLPVALAEHSHHFQRKKIDESVVRAWTCELTDRFGAEGDAVIADTFMDQPYMDHHVYLVALLELAFFPNEADSAAKQEALDVVLYPRGPGKEALSKKLFDRMITEFEMTCQVMGVQRHFAQESVTKLKKYRSAFASETTIVGGINAPHILAKKPKRKNKHSSKTKVKKAGKVNNGKKPARESDATDSETVSSHSCSSHSESKKFSWFSLFGSSKKTHATPLVITAE